MRLLAALALSAGMIWAHCDRVDGPVAKAASRALATGEVAHALIWVPPSGEAAVRAAFESARASRTNERSFLETVVRLHRAGEGAPFTGLKPAGGDPGPAITAADASVESGSPEQALEVLRHAVEHGLLERFRRVEESRRFAATDVAAGRAYVKAYVELLHYVERVHQAAASAAEEHEH